VPELAFIEVAPHFGMGEAHAEIRDMLNASEGLNLGLRFLADSLEYNPLLKPPPAPDEAAAVVWFDSFVTNVDRTPRNVNILVHQHQLWLIDHGASLFFHHSPDWFGQPERALTPFVLVKDHALLGFAASLPQADALLKPRLPSSMIEHLVHLLPDAWLLDGATPVELRAGYERWLTDRLAASEVFVNEAERARARAV
jgi:hypothetical protein